MLLAVVVAAALAGARAQTPLTGPEALLGGILEPVSPEDLTEEEMEVWKEAHGGGGLDLSHQAAPEGEAVLDGDMILTEEQQADATGRKMISDASQKWPNKTVYYSFGDDKVNRSLVEVGLNVWRKQTCIKFVEVPASSTRHHIVITNDAAACYTNIGYTGKSGKNGIMKLSPRCVKDIQGTIHEFGHSIGFYHEQMRPDRNEKLIVHLQNADPKLHLQFTQFVNSKTNGLPYDYYSVMHYGGNAGSANPSNWVMETKEAVAQFMIGNGMTLTHWDRLAACQLYDCFDEYVKKCNVSVDHCNKGILEYSASNNTCWCTCPLGTSGAKCETVDKPYYDAQASLLFPNLNVVTASKGVIKTNVTEKKFVAKGLTRWLLRAPECHKLRIKFLQLNLCAPHTGLIILTYTYDNGHTAPVPVRCPTTATVNRTFNLPVRKVNIYYLKMVDSNITGPPPTAFEMEYEHVADDKCSRCVAGNCPKPFGTVPGANVEDVMSVDQIGYYLDGLKANYSHKVKVIEYGKSSGGHPLRAVMVKPYMKRSVRNAKYIPDRKSVFVEAGFQANNQISTAASLTMIDELTKDCKSKCDIDYYIVPLVNPDGYEYVLKNNSWMFAKNLESTKNASCKGVNLFYNFKKPTDAGDTDPCSQTNQGPSEMSAAETKYLTTIKKNVKNIVLTIVADQWNATTLEGSITAPYLSSTKKDAYKSMTDAFQAGMHEVTPSINYTLKALKDLPLKGSVLHYNQATFGNTYRVSLPTFSFPQISRRERSVKEFVSGVRKMIMAI